MSDRAEKAGNVVGYVLGIPLALVLGIWTIWITITAFIGGQAPFFFAFTGFSLIRGLFWLFIVDPIVVTLAYWAFVLIMLPVTALVAALASATEGKARDAEGEDQ